MNATQEAWATFLTSPRGNRRLPTKEIELEGSEAEVGTVHQGLWGKACGPLSSSSSTQAVSGG